MKIFDAKQMRDWDAYSISQQSITSLELIERAAQHCTDWILDQQYKKRNILVICGKGNNGGDGLAIARQLHNNGIEPKVLIADFNETESGDYKENLLRLQKTNVTIEFIKTETDFSKINTDAIVVEAIFGSGLNRPLSGLYALLINFINELNTTVISIDVPAGMFTDTSSKDNPIIKAAETLTFQTMKLCFLMADNADYFGNVHVLHIGLSEDYAGKTETKFAFTDLSMAASFYKKRKQFSHKGTYGHALLVAGNEGKMGAAVMCATSCLRSGVGLLTCSVPQNDFSIIHITIPEAMLIARGKEDDVSKYEVIGMGPGLGKEDETVSLVHSMLQQMRKPMVIDADALNILSEHKEWMNDIPKETVLTPHPKEFDRLFGDCKDDFERMDKAIQQAAEYNIIIILKGSYTLVTDGKRNFYNSTGNNGMATGGSGDTLTGIVTALFAQHYQPFEAAVVAVFAHGLSADLCLDIQSYESLLPTDISANLGKAFQQLQNNKGA